MTIAFFEGGTVEDFTPLTLTHPAFELHFGRSTILEGLVEILNAQDYFMFVRRYLAAVTSVRHPTTVVNPRSAEGEVLFINSLAKPTSNLVELAKKKARFVATSGSEVVIARLGSKSANRLLEKSPPLVLSSFREVNEDLEDFILPESEVLRYPWELIRDNPDRLASSKPLYSVASNSQCKVIGDASRVTVHPSAEVEDQVILDVRNGPISIQRKAVIKAFSRINGPASIGEETIVSNAQIGAGSTIGRHCRVSGEVDNAIIASYTNKSHEGFFGHSYAGEWVNLGALTTTSDLKHTYGTIKMTLQGQRVDTGLLKIGCFIGDNARTSIGTFLYSGLRIGVASHLHGYVTEDVPSFTIYGGTVGVGNFEVDLESAIQSQRRMMARRDVEQSPEEVELLRTIFMQTGVERQKTGVAKGRFRLGT